MVNYSQFNTTENVGLNIKNALDYCKQSGEDTLVFPKGTYEIDKEHLENRFLCISNHSQGDRKICFLLDGFENFTLDFCDSELILKDLSIAAVITGCKNITIKNVKIYNEVTLSGEGVIEDVTENSFTITVTDGNKFFTNGETLFSGDPEGLFDQLIGINEWDKETGLLVPYQTDISLADFTFEQLSENTFVALAKPDRMKKYVITKGNRFCIQHRHRNSCGIFINESVNTKLLNVTIHNTMGMGVIAQNCENVEIDSMKVTPKNNSCHTLNADATHFVHCKGLIHVHDCFFERQLDDALNVHGIYMRITEKKENSLILSFMHNETMGIDTFKKGSVLQTCDPQSLIPKKNYRVSEVKKIDLKQIEVFFDDDISDVTEGDDMCEVSDICEVVFENNICKNNRARAVLLASAGKTILRGNLFESSGRTILFEADGAYWFESGGTTDVLITDNTFSNCNYIGAYRKNGNVIMAIPRKTIEEGKYFHKKIEISNNRFVNCKVSPAYINNAEHLIFKNNTFENCVSTEAEVVYVKNYES